MHCLHERNRNWTVLHGSVAAWQFIFLAMWKVKVKIGNKVEPRSFKSSFIQNPTRSHLITQPALVLTRCLWPSPTKPWWQGATLLPLLEEPPTSLFQPVKTAHRWFKGFELLNTSVLDKMPSTLTSQCTLQVNRQTTDLCQYQNSIQGNIYNQGLSPFLQRIKNHLRCFP